MVNILQFSLKSVLMCIVILLPFNTVWSGDEELITPYTELDPETGFYVTKKPAIENTSQHERITSTTAAQEMDNTAGNIPSATPSPDNKLSLLVAGIIILLLGGFIYRFYRVKHSE
jgi:hypothetical protein